MTATGDTGDTQRALSAAMLEDRLDEMLDAVLSIRRSTATAAAALAGLARADQDYACHWIEVIAKTNPELAYHFASHVTAAITRMRREDSDAWIIEAMDTYDKLGLYPAVAVLADAESFAAVRDGQARTATLEASAPMLELFLQGLSGRKLKLAPSERLYTDTTTLFLPARLAVLPTRDANRMLYKIMATHLWAQGWFGTFRGDPRALRAEWERYAEPERAAQLFCALETIRLDACLERELPGLYRELRTLRTEVPAAWKEACAPLAKKGASVDDTHQAVAALYGGALPVAPVYQGIIDVDAVVQAMGERIQQERAALQNALAKLAGGQSHTPPPDARFTVSEEPGPQGEVQLMLDGQLLAAPPDVQNLLQSIFQDLGGIPDEYLVAAGDGGYAPDNEKRAEDVWKGTYHEDGAFLYNEWDHRREHYRKDWCVLRELDVHPVHDAFVRETLRKYAGLSARLRKTFEALRGENAVQRRRKNGDDIDFDALVDALADLKSGRELGDRLFLRSRRIARNIAVMLMVDMSGSTKGWINDAERESLVLLSEALEILGDRYAIYGFSGTTRKRCELYRVKEFAEPYTDLVRARISGIRPQDYTRMGVAIRHLCKRLDQVDARTKLLITLSDGKPDDYDGYRGEYGIEDTRQALLEAKRSGIHAFCITIDHDARAYLPHMYGPANYVLIDDVRKLPLKISDIYRHLTS
ncbi:MAG: nitric oxide reductase activation protein [Gammaproteobacteria bacterium]|nr:nitric oxide reductase activation protein [Gammaproteobacteria bacterium]